MLKEVNPKIKRRLGFEAMPLFFTGRTETKNDVVYMHQNLIDPNTLLFTLRIKQGDLTFSFVLAKVGDGAFQWAFTTLGNGFALTKKTNLEDIYLTLESMVRIIRDKDINIREISFSTATARFTIEEVEKCRQELTKANIDCDTVFGDELFSLYKEVFKSEFPFEQDDNQSEVRRRLFKINFKRYLPDWKMIMDGVEPAYQVPENL